MCSLITRFIRILSDANNKNGKLKKKPKEQGKLRKIFVRIHQQNIKKKQIKQKKKELFRFNLKFFFSKFKKNILKIRKKKQKEKPKRMFIDKFV